MLLLILFSLVCAKRTISPEIKQHYQEISQTNYAHNIGSTLLIQYNSYPGVYSMSLSEIVDGQQVQIQQNITLDPFTLPGCYQYQRRLIYKHLVSQQINSDMQTFTDMYIDGDDIFVTRNDNALLQFKIKFDDKNRKILDLELIDTYKNSGFSERHQIFCHQKVCIIFGEKDQTFIYSEKTFNLINLTSIIGEFREFPKDVYFDENSKLIYICYENQIVDVLQFTKSGTINKIKTLIAGQNIVQIRTNGKGDYLYLLDSQLGLISFLIISIKEYELASFQIYLQNSKAFDFYGNTFFIVAESIDGIPYALEVLADGNSYYFNKIYSKDMGLYDVWVGENFALLIGAEINRVIYHSVYNKFVQQSEIPLFFQDMKLVNVEEFKKWGNAQYDEEAIEQEPFQRVPLLYKQLFMVGISSNQISLFSIKSLLPWVQCKPTSKETKEYILKMNSTSCSQMQIQYDHSAFKQCVIDHHFSMTGKEILFYEDDQYKVVAIGSILIGIVILLILICVLAKLYWNSKINQLMNRDHIQLQDQENFNSIKQQNIGD